MKKILLIALTAVTLASCKPTEKNYQSAYDLAVQKREDALQSVIGATLDDMDGVQKQPVGNDTIWVATGTHKTHEAAPGVKSGAVTPGTADSSDITNQTLHGKIGIAVASYSMDTNAKRHAADLRKKIPSAFVATDGQGKYYVIAYRRPDLSEAAKAIREFEAAFPDFSYIGLRGAPMAILLID